MAGIDQPPTRSVARWAVAVPASVACHLLVVFALIRGGVDPSKLAEAADRVPPLEIPIKLGIEKSDATTPNWLGFEIPEKHVADPSPVEQSALTRAEGDQRDNLAQAMSASLRTSTSQAMSDARAVLDAFREQLARAGAQAQEAHQAEAQSEQPTPAQPAEKSAPQTPPAKPTPAQDDQQDGSPGRQDTRSAPPSSKPVELRRMELGSVVSAEGLKINTSRIHLTSLQRAFRPDNSPLVEIFFDQEGNVSEARIPAGRGSGRSDIDQALINAVYEWTASGEPIEALKEGDAPLLIRMRILL